MNLISRVAADERYSYNFDGNSQVLDHVLVTRALAAADPTVTIVHLNADSPESRRASDHDPVVASFALGRP